MKVIVYLVQSKYKGGIFMGMRFRKSINLGGGLRMNLSKSGVGFSAGTKGFRVTKTAKGRTRTTASIPGTGISYVKETSNKKNNSRQNIKPENNDNKINLPNKPKNKPTYKKEKIKKFLIACYILFFIIAIASSCSSKKLESVNLYGIPNSLDINQSEVVEIDIDPTDYDINKLDLKSSDSSIACLVVKDDKLVLETKNEGTADVWVISENITSNKLNVTVVDVKKAEQEAKEKAEQEARIKAEKEAKEKAEQEAALESNSVSNNNSNYTDKISNNVWIAGSGNGTKYHSNPNCSNMKNPVEISLSEAQSRGYDPCKKCY